MKVNDFDFDKVLAEVFESKYKPEKLPPFEHDFKVGDKVIHEKFKEGKILYFIKDKVIIDFNGNVKGLILRFAGLKKVQKKKRKIKKLV